LNKNIDVYCEKPIAVNFNQFDDLIHAIKNSSSSFFAGYNRPYSKAIQTLKTFFNNSGNLNGKFSINCFVSAHDIPSDHWYRNPEEGTRICGNVGHWIDLTVHMLNWRGYIPQNYDVQIMYSNTREPDDNISISITTELGDLATIFITARSEPFEGINETINFQYGKIISKVDDFRNISIWYDDKFYKKRFFPKDVGHKRSVMQPFSKENRDLNEVIASTEIMLHITEMVKKLESNKSLTLIRNL
jgi:predicted dehydrogenase